jgi:hypothetical protein
VNRLFTVSLAAGLERLKTGATPIDFFHVQTEDAGDIEAVQSLIAQQFGMPLQHFCSHAAILASACLVFNGIDDKLCGYESEGGKAVVLDDLLRVILDYCPSFRIVLISRSKPVQSQFEAVELRGLELPEICAYLLSHPDSTPNLQDPETLERLHECSEGLPPHLDRMLKALKVTSFNEVIDAEIEGRVLKAEQVPKSIMQSVNTLARSEDQSSQRSFRLLKALCVLSNGEPIERVKYLLPTEPLRIENALQLKELSLLDIIPILNSVPQIDTSTQKMLIEI